MVLMPIRCHTCGKVVSAKYKHYLDKLKEKDIPEEPQLHTQVNITEESTHSKILKEIGITKMCCRILFLCHVNLYQNS